jgi:hypothetical protein
MGIVAQLPINNFAGTDTIPATAIPDTAVSGSIALDATTPSMQTPGSAISIQIDFSPDGGATWATTSGGGPAYGAFPQTATYATPAVNPKTGLPAATMGPNSPPFPPGTNRKVRGTFIVDGNPITTTAVVSLNP